MFLTYSVLFCNLAQRTLGIWVCKNGILGFKGQNKGVVYQRVLKKCFTIIPTFTDVSWS